MKKKPLLAITIVIFFVFIIAIMMYRYFKNIEKQKEEMQLQIQYEEDVTYLKQLLLADIEIRTNEARKWGIDIEVIIDEFEKDREDEYSVWLTCYSDFFTQFINAKDDSEEVALFVYHIGRARPTGLGGHVKEDKITLPDGRSIYLNIKYTETKKILSTSVRDTLLVVNDKDNNIYYRTYNETCIAGIIVSGDLVANWNNNTSSFTFWSKKKEQVKKDKAKKSKIEEIAETASINYDNRGKSVSCSLCGKSGSSDSMYISSGKWYCVSCWKKNR